VNKINEFVLTDSMVRGKGFVPHIFRSQVIVFFIVESRLGRDDIDFFLDFAESLRLRSELLTVGVVDPGESVYRRCDLTLPHSCFMDANGAVGRAVIDIFNDSFFRSRFVFLQSFGFGILKAFFILFVFPVFFGIASGIGEGLVTRFSGQVFFKFSSFVHIYIAILAVLSILGAVAIFLSTFAFLRRLRYDLMQSFLIVAVVFAIFFVGFLVGVYNG
jgi:hypothetical protein